jgi:quinohemoprotein ethanol dehydrogenase
MKAELIAWDPVAKKARFTIPFDRVGYGGLLATKGNLIFQGAPNGEFIAYSADKGDKLWSFDAQTGVIAGASTFSIDGTQYVAVMAGFGGSTALSAPTDIAYKRPNGRLLVFKLDGTAKLPAIDVTPMPAADFIGTWSKDAVAKGEFLYAGNCGLCHGPSGYGSGMIPDLRRSVMAANKASYDAVVMGGSLEDKGMINFSKWISASDAEAIRGYLASRAKELKQEEAAAKATTAAKSGSK